MKRAIFIAPFEELAEPRVVVDLAVRAEERGWDGFFVWDHIIYTDVRAVADPWVTLAGVAAATSHIAIGPLVTPLPRRRPHQLARETVALDRLSGGRLVFGIGLGGDDTGEFDPARFGEEGDPRARGVLLDEALERLLAYWDGEFEPRPLQQPRIPIWAAAGWPRRKPVRRAARLDGLFPMNLPGPEALAELASEIEDMRGSLDGYDLVVTREPGGDFGPWVEAGATWGLTVFGPHPSRAAVEEVIDGG